MTQSINTDIAPSAQHNAQLALKICSINVRGWTGKADIIQRFINKHTLNITFIQETWLHGNNPRLFPYLFHEVPGTRSENRDRAGGGLACLVDSRTRTNTKLIHSTNHLIAIKVGKTILIGVYFPPSMPKTDFENEISIITGITNNHDQVFIIGDFNARLKVRGDKGITKHRRQILLSEAFPFSRIEPSSTLCTTTITCRQFKKVETITDHCFTNSGLPYTLHVVDEAEIYSDHRPLILQTHVLPYATQKQFRRWNIHALKFEEKSKKFKNYITYKGPETIQKMADNLGKLQQQTDFTGKCAIIEEMHQTLLQLIRNAAENSIGIFKFKSELNRNIWNEEMDQIVEHITLSRREWMQSNHESIENRRKLFKDFQESTKRLQEAISASKLATFQSLCEDWNRDLTTGFTRMVSMMKH
jgi:hypothetical protein